MLLNLLLASTMVAAQANWALDTQGPSLASESALPTEQPVAYSRHAPTVGPDGKLHNWQPSTQLQYSKRNGEWAETAQIHYEYDSRGNCILFLSTEEDGFVYKTVNAYDEYDRCIRSEYNVRTGSYDSPVSTYVLDEYSYDDATGERISTTEFRRMSEDEEWEKYSERISRKTVFRDAAHGDRVTKIASYNYNFVASSDGDYESEFTIDYYFRYNDASSAPYEIEQVYDGEPSYKMTDLVWMCCDPQSLSEELNDYDAVNYYRNNGYKPQPKNLLKKWKVDKTYYKYNCETEENFDGEGGYRTRAEGWDNFTGEWISLGPEWYDMVTFPVVDGYDWYYEVSRDYDGETSTSLKCGYDDHGNQTFEDDGYRVYEAVHTYNPEYGYLEKYEVTTAYPSAIYESMHLYLDYKDYAAASADPLYITGNYEANYWDSENPQEFDWDGSTYSIDIEGVGAFKISTEKGVWPQFYNGCLTAVFDAEESQVSAALVPGLDNILCPWTGDWHIEISGDLSTITMSTATPRPQEFTAVFLRGAMNEWGAEVGSQWQFSTTDGNIYYLHPVVIGDGVEFKVGDSSWAKINYGSYSREKLVLGEANELTHNGANLTIDYAGMDDQTPVEMILNISEKTLMVNANQSGVEAIDADNTPAVYYNLQGVRAVNPSPGVYIRLKDSRYEIVRIR